MTEYRSHMTDEFAQQMRQATPVSLTMTYIDGSKTEALLDSDTADAVRAVLVNAGITPAFT